MPLSSIDWWGARMAQLSDSSWWARLADLAGSWARRGGGSPRRRAGLLAIAALCALGCFWAGATASSLMADQIAVERRGESPAPGGEADQIEDASVEGADGSGGPSSSSGAGSSGEPDAEEAVVVDVTGAVNAPDVIELPAGARVADAIAAAGGLAADADVRQVNRAEPLSDGAKVHIPRQGEDAAARSVDAPGMDGEAAGLVNINTASAEELDSLPGVGPSTAASIIKEREDNGPFSTAEDLMRVSGIGEKRFAQLKDAICT